MFKDKKIVVEMQDICKEYYGVSALKGVSLSLREGEVRALLGENGAGKSTFIKMLTGAEAATSGSIYVNGELVPHMTPMLSEELGIACVYQSMMVANHLTVAENIWLGNMPNLFGIINTRKIFKMTEDILNDLGYAGIISPKEKVGDLSASKKSLVAIARAISRDAKVVIFDEPTAILADREVEKLFEVIKVLKERHIAMIYISHRMEEVFKICDTITVIRDGAYIGETSVSNTNQDDLIAMMVGRRLANDHYVQRIIGQEVLVVEDLNNSKLKDCSLTLKEGEIVGIYGLVGAGRSELLRAIFGADKVSSGRVSIRGHKANFSTPHDGINEGLSLIPEDRRGQGLALQQSVRDNINLAVYSKNNVGGVVKGSIESSITNNFITSLHIKTPNMHQKVKNLSGGNQQKCVLGKWLAKDSKIFFMDEPTNGIDVGAKEEIYALINDLAKDGGAVLCVSSYMPELIGICDRILIMSSGKIVAEVARGETDFNEESMLNYALMGA